MKSIINSNGKLIDQYYVNIDWAVSNSRTVYFTGICKLKYPNDYMVIDYQIDAF